MNNVTEAEARSQGSDLFKKIWPPLAIALVSILLYGITAGYDFVFDDKPLLEFIVKLSDQSGLWGILKTDFRALAYWTSGYYRPVALLTLYVDYAIGGNNPFVYHLTNIFLNAANSALIFYVALNVTRNRWAALLAGILFAVNPSHVETVAFISSQADLLVSFFTLLAVLFWWKAARDDGGRKWAALSGLMIVMAVLSKESGLMVPALLGVFELLIPYDGKKRPLVKRLATWMPEIVAGVLIALAIRFFWAGVPFGSGQYLPIYPDGSTIKQHPLLFPGIWFHYLYLSLAGWPLSAFYSADKVFPSFATVTASIVMLGLFFADRKKLGEHMALLAWFVIFLFPVSGIMPRMGAVVADRFHYLPSAGTAILIGSLALSAARFGDLKAKAALLLVGVMILMHGGFTAARIPSWKNDLALFNQMVVDEPGNTVGYTGIGQELYKAGRYQEAAAYFEKAIAIDQGNYIAYKFLSYVYRYLGRESDADRAARLGQMYEPPWTSQPSR